MIINSPYIVKSFSDFISKYKADRFIKYAIDITKKYIRELGIYIDGDFNVYITQLGLKAGSYLANNTISI